MTRYAQPGRRALPVVRLWLRAAARRPGRGLLVVVGLLAAALATTASLVAADSLDRLFRADAEAGWPGIDVEVRSASQAVFGAGTAGEVLNRAGGLATAADVRLVLRAVPVADDGRREPQARLLGLQASERPRGLAGTTAVERLGPDDVVVGERLAERLGLRPGDPLSWVVAVPQVEERNSAGSITSRTPARAVRWRTTVVGVAADAGVVDLGRTPNAYARLDQLQRVTGLDGKVTALHVRTRDRSAEGAEAFVDAAAPATSFLGLRAETVRADALEAAAEEGGLFRGILLTLAVLVGAAAAVVTAQLLLLLAAERARELAVLRALGARRRAVTGLLTAEGLLYALVAGLLGAALGVPLGDRLATALADHFAGLSADRGREQVDLALTARPATLAAAVLAVVAVAAAAAVWAGRRAAGGPVDAALRGAPPPPPPAPPGRPGRLRGAGLFLTGVGVAASTAGDLALFAGVSLLLAAAWTARRRRTADRRRLDTRAAALGLVWCVLGPVALGDFDQGVQTGFGLLAVAGALAVAAAAVLLGTRLRAVMTTVRAYVPGRRAQAALRVAGAAAEEARGRSGTVATSVGVVTFTVAALAVLGAVTALPPAVQGGGWDVVGTSVAPLDDEPLLAAGAQRLVTTEHTVLAEAAYAVVPEDDDGPGRTVPYPVRLLLLDGAMVDETRHRLAAALPAYRTAAEALLAVSLDPGSAVVDRYALPEGARPGDDVVVRTARGPRSLRLVAVLDTYVLGGVVVSAEAFQQLTPSRGATFLLAAAPDGRSPAALADALEAAAGPEGLVADPVAVAAARVTRANQVFTDVFGLVLLAGLLVALAGVGVLVSRAARERAAAVGVLRALGFRRRGVALALAAEPLLPAVLGLLAGTGLGLVVLRLLFAVAYPAVPFRLDVARLGATTGAVLAALVVVCAVPSVLAARRATTPALRDLG